MTDIATVPTTGVRVARPSALPTLTTGLFGGFALGVVARGWMRFITEDPEFTWSGTIFIVSGFTVFGFTQSIVALAHRRSSRRSVRMIARLLGTIGLLPLFVAAGGVMLPSVVGGGLAVARTQWRTTIRVLCIVVAAVPVVFVAHQLVGSFGWSLRAVTGFISMVALYATIVGGARFTFVGGADPRRSGRRG